MSFPISAAFPPTMASSSSSWTCVSPRQPSTNNGDNSEPTSSSFASKRTLQDYLIRSEPLSSPMDDLTSHLIPASEKSTRTMLHSEIDMGLETVSHQVHKRMRYTSGKDSQCRRREKHGGINSPVDPLLGNPQLDESLSARDNCHANMAVPCISEHGSSLHKEEDQLDSSDSSLVWWKQRRPRPRVTSAEQTSATAACYVCQNPRSQSDDTVAIQTSPTLAKTKTLRSFFAPAPSGSMDATTHHRTSSAAATVVAATVATVAAVDNTKPQQPESSFCTHCERSDMCSNCVRPCQDCLANFCLFCSMIDASGRSVCLECAALSASQSMRSFNGDDEDDDGMQID